MKTMLVSASAVGAVLAGLVLYYRNRQRPAHANGKGKPRSSSLQPARNPIYSMG